MTKKLYLIRHAKSSWKEAQIADIDRPLKGRGVRDAYNSSQWLAQQDAFPDLMLSSPATRALHTALIFAKNLDYAYRDIQIEEGIYEASTAQLGQIVKQLDDRYQRVFLFGHNPTITQFVNSCIDHRIDNVPTTGIACLKFELEKWASIGKEAELVFFDYPKRRKPK